MGFFRFRRSIKLFPGVRWNIGKKSTSLSFGGRGASYTVGTSGSRTTVGIPGTGLSYTETSRSSRPSGENSGWAGCLGQIIVLLLVLEESACALTVVRRPPPLPKRPRPHRPHCPRPPPSISLPLHPRRHHLPSPKAATGPRKYASQHLLSSLAPWVGGPSCRLQSPVLSWMPPFLPITRPSPFAASTSQESSRSGRRTFLRGLKGQQGNRPFSSRHL